MSETINTRLVSFRVDKELKARLEQIAVDSDRSITQLCRYALSSFLLSGAAISDMDLADKDDVSPLSELIGIRLSVDLLQDVSASVPDVPVSVLVRGIIAWWVDNANLADLGKPLISVDEGAAGRE